jgi:hypothetical protein
LPAPLAVSGPTVQRKRPPKVPWLPGASWWTARAWTHHPGGYRPGGGRAGGNVYYYKTKDDIIATVVEMHVDQLEAAFATLERAHRIDALTTSTDELRTAARRDGLTHHD